jgi:hypothetical protein
MSSRSVRFADQHERLAEVVAGQRVVGPVLLGLAEGGDGGRVLAALGFEQAQDHPGGAVRGVLGGAVGELLHQRVEAAALDVVAVQAVQGGAAARVLLQHAEEAVHDLLFALLVRRRLVGGEGQPATQEREGEG